jgi:hypothetical protein
MRRHLVSLTLLCTLLSACDRCGQSAPLDAGVPDAGPPVLTEKEPNDAPQTALALERSSVVEGNLAADPARADEDWYVLKAGLPRTVDLQVTCPPGADLALEVVDTTRAVLTQINAGGPGVTEHLPDLDVSQPVYVRVMQLKRGAGGAYTLTATFRERAPGFELEPNDRRVDATQVALGQAVSGYLSHPTDVDFYRFELPQEHVEPAAPAVTDDDGGLADAGSDAGTPELDAGVADAGGPERRLALRIDVSPVDGVSFDVAVQTEADAVIFEAKSAPGAGLSLRNVGVRASDQVLYVVVRSTPITEGKVSHNGFNAQTYYTLTVAPEEAGASAELEPNDDPAHATLLPPNSYREGFISPRGDVDYYLLKTDGPSVAKLSLTGVERVDLELSVVRVVDGKPEETLLKANEGAAKEPEVLPNVSCDGACLIKVAAVARKVDGKWVREDENGDQSYRLSTQVEPDDGSTEREPNNTADQATPLTFGKPMRGTVYPRRDVDYFKVDLREREVKTPLEAKLLGILKVDVGLYLHRVEADGKLTLVQTSDSAKGDKPETVRYSAEPGLYVFEVRDAKNREANFQDAYQLTVEEGGD